MEFEERLRELLNQAEDDVKALLKEQDDYRAIEICLSVGRELQRIQNGIRAVHHAPHERIELRERTLNYQASFAEDSSFRYYVKDNELHRLGRRTGKDAEYLQTVDERTFTQIVEAAQERMVLGDHRLRATNVHREIGRVPYYQVNLTISFLRDAGVVDEAQTTPENLVDLAKRAWESHRQP